MPPETVASAKDIRVPLQGHFANRDDWCTPAAVDKFEAELKAAGKTAEIFRYDAEHAFVNEQRDVHDRAAAELAWERMLAFWSQHFGHMSAEPSDARRARQAKQKPCKRMQPGKQARQAKRGFK